MNTVLNEKLKQYHRYCYASKKEKLNETFFVLYKNQ